MMALHHILLDTAVASAEGGGASLVTPDLGMVFWTVVNFVILLFLLWKFAWGPFSTALAKREDTIRDSVEGATKALAEAQEKQEEQAKLLREARSEVSTLIEQGRTEAQKVKDDLIAKAREEAQDLVEKARRQIEQEQTQAIAQVRSVAADLAVAAAERLLETALDEARHRKVVDDYIESLPKGH